MKSFTKIAAAFVIAAMLISATAKAQESGLTLRFNEAQGVPGVWALLPATMGTSLTVSQSDMASRQDAKIYLVYSPIQVLGELDQKNVGLWFEQMVHQGQDLTVKFAIPKSYDETAWSVQAIALFDDGSMAASSVTTLIVDTQLYLSGQNNDPGEGSGADDGSDVSKSDAAAPDDEPAVPSAYTKPNAKLQKASAQTFSGMITL